MTLPSTMMLTTSRRLARLGNMYSPNLSSSRARRTRTPPMNTIGCSITPSRCSRSAMSRTPRFLGMLTVLSRSSGPGVSNRCLPVAIATPPISAASKIRVKTALPAMTSGWRARAEGRLGSGRRSGSSAARELRGVNRLLSETSRSRADAAVERSSACVGPVPVPRGDVGPCSVAMSTLYVLRQRYDEIWQKGERILRHRAPKDERRVGAAETERVRQHEVDIAPARLMRHEIDRRFDRWLVEIDGGRRNLIAQRENREDRLDRAGRAQQMTDRRLG